MLSFRTPFASYDAVPFDSNFNAFLDPIIAPFWADYEVIDFPGSISYRRTADISILRKVTNILVARNPELQSYQPLLAFIATWNGDLQEVSDLNTKLNTRTIIIMHRGASEALQTAHVQLGG